MPVYLLLWHQQCGRGKKSWQKNTWLPISLWLFVFCGTNDEICQLGKRKSYISWMVTAVVGLSSDSKESNFRNSLVSCHVFHDSAVVVCVLNAYRRIQTSGSVCCCVWMSREFVLVAVLSCSYLSFCLFGSTDFVAQLSEVQQILPPFMSWYVCASEGYSVRRVALQHCQPIYAVEVGNFLFYEKVHFVTFVKQINQTIFSFSPSTKDGIPTTRASFSTRLWWLCTPVFRWTKEWCSWVYNDVTPDKFSVKGCRLAQWASWWEE